MSPIQRWRHALATGLACLVPMWAGAQAAATNSSLDAPLFYQLLIGELELSSGQAGTAYEIMLDAARRSRNDQLFQRAADIALQARAGEQALAAARAWRSARPESLEAARLEVQILAALNRLTDAAEPLRALIQLTPAAERAGLIAALPRAVQRAPDRKRAAQILDDVLAPLMADRSLALAARVASGRGWLGAGDGARALALAQQAHQSEPQAPGPVLLALELMATTPQAEAIVLAHLQTAKPEATMRLAYVRTLTNAQRYADAVRQLEVVTSEQPELAAPHLTLGALQLELRHTAQGEAALKRYLALAEAQAGAGARTKPPHAPAASDDDDEQRPDQGVIEARLLLARAAEQRGDFAAAEAWLARVDDPKRALEVQTRRATILARQGRIAEARETVRRTPERSPEDARAKLVAEAGMLRDAKRWGEAYEVLGKASERFAGDTDLLYEQAMMAEKLNRLDDAERLLRKVIEIKPDNAHAHNALGYSLADRGLRLDEARGLIARALELSPGDPFITDSLGWVEFRLGNLGEAIALLRKAYAARPDTEIAAHLGEVLWAAGQRDDARRIWRDAKSRDEANEVLRETLARLRADL